MNTRCLHSGPLPCIAIALLALLPTPVRAQPEKPAPQELPVETVLTSIRNAYRKAPLAERVAITIRRPGAPGAPRETASERREEAVVRIDPVHGLARDDAKVWLELGDLRACLSGGRMVAVHTRDSATYVQLDYKGPLTQEVLSRLLPPLPLPQIDLALGDADPPTRLTPYFDGIKWDKVAVDETVAPPRVTITGSASGRRVEITADADTGRLLRLTAELDHPPAGAPALELRLVCTRMEVDPAAAWEIPTTGRARVADLAQLRARPGDLQVGQVVPSLGLTTVDGRAWSMTEDLGPGADDPLPPRPCVILLLVRDRKGGDGPRGPDDPFLGQTVAAIAAAVKEAHESALTPVPPGVSPPARIARCAYRPTLVLDLGAGDAVGRVRVAAEVWTSRLLWTASPATTIDRFAPGAAAAVVVIDADHVLRCVIPIGEDSQRDPIHAELIRCLTGARQEPPEPQPGLPPP